MLNHARKPAPGLWIVTVGHLDEMSAQSEKAFFPGSYVKKVTKLCDDPLDVS